MLFGNLRNSGMYEGIWGNVTDDNRVWIGSRNGVTFGRWDHNNPMVLAAKPLEENQYYVVAGRMGSGTGEVQVVRNDDDHEGRPGLADREVAELSEGVAQSKTQSPVSLSKAVLVGGRQLSLH